MKTLLFILALMLFSCSTEPIDKCGTITGKHYQEIMGNGVKYYVQLNGVDYEVSYSDYGTKYKIGDTYCP